MKELNDYGKTNRMANERCTKQETSSGGTSREKGKNGRGADYELVGGGTVVGRWRAHVTALQWLPKTAIRPKFRARQDGSGSPTCKRMERKEGWTEHIPLQGMFLYELEVMLNLLHILKTSKHPSWRTKPLRSPTPTYSLFLLKPSSVATH